MDRRTMHEEGADVTQLKSGSPGKRALKIILVIILVTTLIAAIWVKQTLYAGTFTPVALGSEEQKVLNKKLALPCGTQDSPIPNVLPI